MNKSTVVFALVFGASVGSAGATPIQYSFSAAHTYEVNADHTTPANYLFANGTVLSGHFGFERSAPAVLTNASDPGALSGYGLYSIYFGAVQQLTAQVDGHIFLADTGSTLVANSDSGGSTPYDGVFNIAGNLNGDEVGTGFSGFSLDGFTLKSFNLYSIGWPNYVLSQALPVGLSNGPLSTGINLIFEDTEHREREVNFWGSANIVPSPVPVPAAGWLFGAAITGLIQASRRKARLRL